MHKILQTAKYINIIPLKKKYQNCNFTTTEKPWGCLVLVSSKQTGDNKQVPDRYGMNETFMFCHNWANKLPNKVIQITP